MRRSARYGCGTGLMERRAGKGESARNTDTGQTEMSAMPPAVNPLEALAGEWTFQGSPSEVRESDSAQDPDAVRGSSSIVRRSASWGHLPSAVYCTPNERKRQHRSLLALKTNLLFDLALVPNIEIEVPLDKQNRWSVNGEWMFPWWLIDHDKYCLQILSGGVEGRYWLGSRFRRLSRPALTGHFRDFMPVGENTTCNGIPTVIRASSTLPQASAMAILPGSEVI